MSVTVASFRAAFPEFGNSTTYPDATVNYWIALAGRLLNADRWGDLLDDGVMLFAAHNLVLSAHAVSAASNGGVAGASGLVASKQVDKVAVSYDTGSVALEGGGEFNATSYGRRYFQLARLVGIGGGQL